MNAGMTLIVKTTARLVLTFIMVFAAALALYGHVTPGGGFAGGAVAACGLILMLLAFGRLETAKVVGKQGASTWECVGALGFLVIALVGYTAGMFFTNVLPEGETFRLLSAGTVLWSNVAIFVKITAGLFAVYAVLAAFRMAEEPTQEERP